MNEYSPVQNISCLWHWSWLTHKIQITIPARRSASNTLNRIFHILSRWPVGMNFSNTQLITIKLTVTTDTINLIVNWKIVDLQSKHNICILTEELLPFNWVYEHNKMCCIRPTGNVHNNQVSEHQVNEP